MTTVELQKRIAGIPESERDTAEFAHLLNDLAVTCQTSNLSETETLYKRSLAIWQARFGPDHPHVGVSLWNLSALYRKTRRFAEAERLFQKSQRILRSAPALSGDGEPLRSERYDPAGVLENFGSDVRNLRARVDGGSAEARVELQDTIAGLGAWYHNLNFSGCSTLPLTPDYPASRWRILDPLIPKDLSGKTILDIGCNSGFFSIEMKRRGAKQVIGIDIMPHVLAQARFVSHWFGLPIELHELSVYDLESLGMQFDIVLFVGVLYHLKHPLYALEKIASVCRETMFLMSMVRGSKGEFLPAEDYPGDEVKVFAIHQLLSSLFKDFSTKYSRG